MIIETVFQWCCNFIVSLFSVFEFIDLPLGLINSLFSIISFGVWVVGADVFLLVTGSIMGWLTFKSSAGLIVWLYKLLPLT